MKHEALVSLSRIVPLVRVRELARVLRLMRAAGLLAPSRVGGPRGLESHAGTIIPESPNRLWGTDLTTALTTEQGQVAVFIAIDRATAELVDVRAAKRATRYEALEPPHQEVRRFAGTVAENVAVGLTVRHVHVLTAEAGAA